MSTWHQDKAGPLAAPTSWCIETNPPNQMRTRMSGFPSREAAQARLDDWKSRNVGDWQYSYVVGPPRDYDAERRAR